jgi:ectoine hydroxylase-related dioxygenase (phytanoyl-CoA dioxygenase family)
VLVPTEPDLVAAVQRIITPALLAQVRQVLPEPALDCVTVIQVDPGASSMELHRDTPEIGSVTVQVPLGEMAENAPLGFCVGTHSIPKKDSRNMYIQAGFRMDAKLQQAVFEAFCPKGPLRVTNLGLGDIAMYDSRLYHWSDEHKEDKPRRALYVVFRGDGHNGVHAGVAGGTVAEQREAFGNALLGSEL